MIKKTINLLFAALIALPLCASADDDGFKIHMNNGMSKEFTFTEVGKIQFNSEGFFVLDTQKNLLGGFQFDEVAKITFEGITTGLGQTMTDESENISIKVDYAGTTLSVSGLNSQKRNTMRLYNVSGNLIMNSSEFNDSQIDISALPEGIYILSVNNTTFKFKK